MSGETLQRSAGLVEFVPNDELDRREREAEKARNPETEPVITSLAAHIRRCWEQASQAKQSIERRLLDCLRRRKGVYESDFLAVIKQAGLWEKFLMLTDCKCQAAESWILDVIAPADEKPWTLQPTPVPSIPEGLQQQIAQLTVQQAMADAQATGQMWTPDMAYEYAGHMRDSLIQQAEEEAKARAARMEKKIEDQLTEGSFAEALDAFVYDVTTYPTAFVKGPLVRMTKTLEWGPGFQPLVTDTPRECYERVSPFDMFPAPEIRNLNEGYVIERQRYTRAELTDLRGVDGYSDQEIDAVLEEHGRGGLVNWTATDSQERQIRNGESVIQQNPIGLIEGLEFWGSVQGAMLWEWGLPVSSLLDEYEISAILIGNHVIRAVVNPDPLGERPYSFASFERDPDSVWGLSSVPEKMAPAQDLANSTIRSLANNLGICSGPQVAIDVSRLADGEDISDIRPMRIWQLKNVTTTQLPIHFFQPDCQAEKLLAIYERAERLADDLTSIPRYVTGDERVGGAGSTASGLAMLLNAAAKGIRRVIAAIDRGILKTVIRRQYRRNLMLLDDESLKGDCEVRARGALGVLVKEQITIKRQEFLNATANPIDMQIIGLEGRARVLRETVKALDIPADDVVPDKEQLAARLAAQAQLAMAQQQRALPPGNEQNGEEEQLDTARERMRDERNQQEREIPPDGGGAGRTGVVSQGNAPRGR